MKLISRMAWKSLKKRPEHKWEAWSEWEECAGTAGLSFAECQQLVQDWADGDTLIWRGGEYHVVTTFYKEEYRIVQDNLDVQSLNEASKD